MQSEAKRTAKNVLRKYRFGHITVDNLAFLIETAGFELIDFGSSSDELLKQLELSDYAECNPAFTYTYGDVKAVFVRDDLPEAEKCYVLAHEYGHIALNHLDRKISAAGNVRDEWQANEFAHYLLNPDRLTIAAAFVSMHKLLVAVLTAVILAAAVLIPFGVDKVQDEKYYGDYYVTQSGKKYHNADCSYIKDKSNTRRLTNEEYESGDYVPCNVCVKETEVVNAG